MFKKEAASLRGQLEEVKAKLRISEENETKLRTEVQLGASNFEKKRKQFEDQIKNLRELKRPKLGDDLADSLQSSFERLSQALEANSRFLVAVPHKKEEISQTELVESLKLEIIEKD